MSSNNKKYSSFCLLNKIGTDFVNVDVNAKYMYNNIIKCNIIGRKRQNKKKDALTLFCSLCSLLLF